jgi:hypothetical protein
MNIPFEKIGPLFYSHLIVSRNKTITAAFHASIVAKEVWEDYFPYAEKILHHPNEVIHDAKFWSALTIAAGALTSFPVNAMDAYKKFVENLIIESGLPAEQFADAVGIDDEIGHAALIAFAQAVIDEKQNGVLH